MAKPNLLSSLWYSLQHGVVRDGGRIVVGGRFCFSLSFLSPTR